MSANFLERQLFERATSQEAQEVFSAELRLSQMLSQTHQFNYDIFYSIGNQQIGDGTIAIYYPLNQISFYTFYPLRNIPDLKRHYIATLAHASTLLQFAQKHPEGSSFLVDHSVHLSRAAQLFLQAMDLNPFARYPLNECLDKSIAFARKKGFSF